MFCVMTSQLSKRSSERDQLLAEVDRRLREDKRVVAAWLHGSLGRGQADQWSDIDIWVVVEDDFLPELVANRHAEAAKVGEPILTVEANRNGAPGGAYLMAGYDFPLGLQLVDWYWQPRSLATQPPDTRLLFTREALGSGGSSVAPLTPWNPTPEENRVNVASLAWAMIAIQAKYIVRLPNEDLKFFEFLGSLVRQVSEAPLPSLDSTSPISKTNYLRALGDVIQPIIPQSERVKGSVNRLLSVVTSSLKSQSA